jgi:hypothetical protein
MEKYYKLIQTFPGSPKLGYIAREGEFNFLDESPDHWEILILTGTTVKDAISGCYYRKQKNGKWRCMGQSPQTKPVDTIEYTINDKEIGRTRYVEVEIIVQSVTRDSDGVIFSIGDKVDRSDGRYKGVIIRGFNTGSDGNILISFSGGIGATYYERKGCNLSIIEHHRPVLFTTEDGVHLYDSSDVVYVVEHDKFKFFNQHHGACIGVWLNGWYGALSGPNDNPEASAEAFMKKYFKIFSTEEAGNEYIMINKPCLSLNNILDSAPKLSQRIINLLKIQINDTNKV